MLAAPNPEATQVHRLPCTVKHTGPANVDKFFKPDSIRCNIPFITYNCRWNGILQRPQAGLLSAATDG